MLQRDENDSALGEFRPHIVGAFLPDPTRQQRELRSLCGRHPDERSPISNVLDWKRDVFNVVDAAKDPAAFELDLQ